MLCYHSIGVQLYKTLKSFIVITFYKVIKPWIIPHFLWKKSKKHQKTRVFRFFSHLLTLLSENPRKSIFWKTQWAWPPISVPWGVGGGVLLRDVFIGWEMVKKCTLFYIEDWIRSKKGVFPGRIGLFWTWLLPPRNETLGDRTLQKGGPKTPFLTVFDRFWTFFRFLDPLFWIFQNPLFWRFLTFLDVFGQKRGSGRRSIDHFDDQWTDLDRSDGQIGRSGGQIDQIHGSMGGDPPFLVQKPHFWGVWTVLDRFGPVLVQIGGLVGHGPGFWWGSVAFRSFSSDLDPSDPKSGGRGPFFHPLTDPRPFKWSFPPFSMGFH